MLNLLFEINMHSFIFGGLAVLFVMILMRKKRKEGKDYDEAICEDSRFYLNIFFNNRKEIVENIVRSKVSRNKVLLRAVAKRFAVKLMTEKLINKVANDLIVTIPKKLELQSIIATASIVHQHSSYLCIEVNIVGVDFLLSIARNGGQEKADKTRRFLESFGFPSIINFINTNLVRLAASKVIKALPTTIVSKLQDKLTADLDVICLNDREQGPFLCQTLQQLKMEDEKEKEEKE